MVSLGTVSYLNQELAWTCSKEDRLRGCCLAGWHLLKEALGGRGGSEGGDGGRSQVEQAFSEVSYCVRIVLTLELGHLSLGVTVPMHAWSATQGAG